MTSRFVAGLPAVFVLGASCLCAAPSAIEETVSLSSPDGRLEITVMPPHAAAVQASPAFSVSFRGRELLRESALGLVLEGKGDLLAGARLTSVRREKHDETYRVLAGKQNPIRNHYRELLLNFKSPGGYQTQVFVRAFNDSVAFSYAIPAQPELKVATITDEKSIFRLVGNPQTHLLYRDSYTTSHEGLYETVLYNALQGAKLIDLPVLFEFEEGTAVAISEANLQHYAGMYLRRAPGTDRSGLISDLSPLPSQTQIKVKVAVPMVSPWRVILVGD